MVIRRVHVYRIVLVSVFSTVCIEGWKTLRVTKASLVVAHGLPWLRDGRSLRAGRVREEERQTEEIDAQGMRILSRVMYPLVAVYAAYALVAKPHKSWWSWFIHSLAHWVYVFQFLGMTPQLFVNYKLKSVAHMPWRPLMYKAFNTFIDDVFAWLIEMPLGHRIACLRDDVVFVVYLYQRYIYRVDKTRPNDFGVAYELPATAPTPAPAAAAAAAPHQPDTLPGDLVLMLPCRCPASPVGSTAPRVHAITRLEYIQVVILCQVVPRPRPRSRRPLPRVPTTPTTPTPHSTTVQEQALRKLRPRRLR